MNGNNKEYYTVEEVAEVLNLHVKTVRRFLREERIRGKKVGRAWTVSREALRDFAHAELAGEGEERHRREIRPVTVSAVVEFYEGESDRASRISNSLMAMLNCKDPSWGPARYDLVYHPEEGKARFVLYGSPAFIGEIMVFFKNIEQEE